MRIPSCSRKNDPQRGASSLGVSCLLALALVGRVKPLAQEVAYDLCSDRDQKIDEILHTAHLPSAA